MKHARLFVSLVGLAFVACQDQPTAPRISNGPFFEIRDGHDVGVGNPGFFFLTPIRRLVDDARVPRTGFNATLAPVIEVYQCSGTNAGCVLPLGALKSRITRNSGTTLLNRLYVLPGFQEYAALWDTKNLGLEANKTYRIQVKLGGEVLGYADVDVVRTIRELTGVNRDEFVPLLQNFILPIRFWIGDGALCTGTCSSKTITLADGGTVELTTPVEHFKFDVPVATTATSGGQPVTDVTFTLETCSGIDVDLPKFGQCLRVSTRFSGTGVTAALSLSNPAKVSMCVLEPGLPKSQEDFITLHQQDGDLIRALPHVAPNCTVIGARASESRGLVTRGWQWFRDFAGTFFTPQPLYAGSRTALFNLGGGGQTHLLGAACAPALSAPAGIALATCVPAVAPQLTTPVPAAGHTISDFQFALPAKMEPVEATSPKVFVSDQGNAAVANAFVTFEVTSGGGTITAREGAGNTQVSPTKVISKTGLDGEAALAAWTLGAGINTVRASGVGIAGRGDDGPFMPDIHLITAGPVTLQTGELLFSPIANLTLPIACARVAGGDLISRGFYVPRYPNATVDAVTLYFSARTAGDYTLRLTARAGAFNGADIATATTTVTLTAVDTDNRAGVFTFTGSPLVAAGTTVAFLIERVSGAGPANQMFFALSNDRTCPVVETESTTPPLSTPRFGGRGVGIQITGTAPSP
jgi:hypothetical protein